MRVYVAAESALEHYRKALMPAGRDAATASVIRKDAASRLNDVRKLSMVGLGVDEPSPETPLHVLVRNGMGAGRSKSVIASVWGGPVPRGALRKVSSDVYVSSPEFLFLQMARRLELVPLVELGMELCGTYRRHAMGDETTYEQPTLTTPHRLKSFVRRAGSVHGAKRAREALKYIEPNSASPFETIVYLLLCLPRRLGGYAFPHPTLNTSVKLSVRGREHTLRRSSIPDLYWGQAELDLECHGSAHELMERRTEDSMRRKALERMRIEVIELTYDEAKDPDLFYAAVRRIAKKLGFRLRARTENNFTSRERDLRRTLFPANAKAGTLWQNRIPPALQDGEASEADLDALPPEYESWEVYLFGMSDEGVLEEL